MEWIGLRVILQRVFRQGNLEMPKRYEALKAQFRGGSLKVGNGNGIVEDVMEPAETNRIGRNAQAGLEKLEVVTFPRPEHHAMLPEANRLGVAVDCVVAYGKQRHIML